VLDALLLPRGAPRERSRQVEGGIFHRHVAGALDLGVLSPALPALGRAFAVGPRELAWVFTLYLLANVVAIPVMSKLAMPMPQICNDTQPSSAV